MLGRSGSDAVRTLSAPARGLGRRLQRGARCGRRRRSRGALGPAVRPVATGAGPRTRRKHKPSTAGHQSATGTRLISCQTEHVAGSICDVLPAAASLLGASGAVDRLGLAGAVGRPDHVDRVAVVLVDGMGWHLLAELADDAPLLASVLAGDIGRLQQLACTFPSTT